MEKYENLGLVGEGSYGMVMKCRHKESGQLVAIKKFLETENDRMVKKIALREVRMLKQLRHENLVNLIEVFRRKKRLYLVFEFVDHTALDDLEKFPSGADENYVKKIMWQVLKGVEFCHQHNVLHRDVKPENILISKRGVVKICDFGFARAIAPPGEVYTDYVATRWYRAPELLVGDTNYGKAVDVWAIGCLYSEMVTGEPLFPGESDIDQLYLITRCFGNLIARHREVFSRNPLFVGMRLPEARDLDPLERRYPRLSPASMDMIKWSLKLDPTDRPTCTQLLRHELFQHSGWAEKYMVELRSKIHHEFAENPLLKNLGVTIYGSVHDAQHSKDVGSERLPVRGMSVHADHSHHGMPSGAEAMASGTEDVHVKKKESKKKKVKKELLLGRDKMHSEMIHEPKKKPLKPLHFDPMKASSGPVLDYSPAGNGSHHNLQSGFGYMVQQPAGLQTPKALPSPGPSRKTSVKSHISIHSPPVPTLDGPPTFSLTRLKANLGSQSNVSIGSLHETKPDLLPPRIPTPGTLTAFTSLSPSHPPPVKKQYNIGLPSLKDTIGKSPLTMGKSPQPPFQPPVSHSHHFGAIDSTTHHFMNNASQPAFGRSYFAGLKMEPPHSPSRVRRTQEQTSNHGFSLVPH